MTTPRPKTPILDAWRREMRRRYGDPVPAAAIAEQVGTPTWYAAAWEQTALDAWAAGCAAATIVADLLRPYQDLAAAAREDDDDGALTSEERWFLAEVQRARQPLSATDRLRVLRLAERTEPGEAAG